MTTEDSGKLRWRLRACGVRLGAVALQSSSSSFLVTMTTVGYGDYFPTSLGGKESTFLGVQCSSAFFPRLFGGDVFDLH